MPNALRPFGEGDRNGRFGDRGGSGEVFGPNRSRQPPSGGGREAFHAEVWKRGIPLPSGLGSDAAEASAETATYPERLRAIRPGAHLRERVMVCLERAPVASRGDWRRPDPSGEGRADAEASPDAKASVAVVSDQALGRGPGDGASASSSWSHPSPDGYYRRKHTRCRTTDPMTSVDGTDGRQRRRPRSPPVDARLASALVSISALCRNRGRQNTRPRTGAEAIAPAAVKTSTFGRRRRQSQPAETMTCVLGQGPREPRPRQRNPALSGKGERGRNRDREARRPRTMSSEIANRGHENQRLRTMAGEVASRM